ncbi:MULTISPECIES: cell division protein FtsQ/DivIB [unclassified Ruegeria]|uniref:cell division protein FtsQ/DivIB n=1 Tax=unclassified Ruegeria TaxID=2625375 RepID=UPI001487A341|nr:MULTISPECIES: cell division protein FtsQ/DivIB [unclassified Ruegeria]NOD34725.1 FtsQ-type POTRA domain-containing protein [Ruegeria sp. HKCCD7296]NOE41805.1 FtsQ-type POTRA domain-containing protein [Ruegeria sp. HKCCD7319]
MRPLTASRSLEIHRSKPLAGPDADFASADTETHEAEPLLRLRGARVFCRTARRSDPAPSRLSYRLQRWMLTPGIRMGVKVGLPICAAAAAVGLYFASEDRREAVTAFVADIRTSIQERPEFMVNLMAIDGAGTSLSEDIREVVPLDFPISSWDLDVEHMRDTITGLDPVKSATVRIRPGGILQVDVVERQPVIVWRTRDGLELLDETGAHVKETPSRKDHIGLPLIAGKGADVHVAEALELFQTSRSLGNRVRGLVRVGERRWDLVLDRGQRIMLPTDRPVRALERVLAVNEVQDLLERDVAVVDMRLGQRPTIRMSKAASEDWWNTKVNVSNGQ